MAVVGLRVGGVRAVTRRWRVEPRMLVSSEPAREGRWMWSGEYEGQPGRALTTCDLRDTATCRTSRGSAPQSGPHPARSGEAVPEPPRICLPCSTLRAPKGYAFSVPSKSTHLLPVTTPTQDPHGEGILGMPHTGLAKKFMQVFHYIL